MKRAALALILLALAGCANGIARYSAEPVMLDGQPVCCKVEVANGKEIGQLKLHLERRDGFWVLDLEETNVDAFEGQRIAAGAASKMASTAGKAAAAAALAPVIPAVLPAAAAAGAGAVLIGQELAK